VASAISQSISSAPITRWSDASASTGEARLQSEWECALYGAAGVAHHPELTQLLLDRGADPNDGEVGYHAPETMDNRTMHVLVESGKLTQDTIRLMLARKMNWHDDSGVAWLLDHGADANYAGHWGTRPLHDALAHGTPLHYFERLLDHGANPALATKDGASSFAAAARLGRADVLDLFEQRILIAHKREVIVAGELDVARAADVRCQVPTPHGRRIRVVLSMQDQRRG
jgi:hypothetical protein